MIIKQQLTNNEVINNIDSSNHKFRFILILKGFGGEEGGENLFTGFQSKNAATILATYLTFTCLPKQQRNILKL